MLVYALSAGPLAVLTLWAEGAWPWARERLDRGAKSEQNTRGPERPLANNRAKFQIDLSCILTARAGESRSAAVWLIRCLAWARSCVTPKTLTDYRKSDAQRQSVGHFARLFVDGPTSLPHDATLLSSGPPIGGSCR
jgi:hypothetical protein